MFVLAFVLQKEHKLEMLHKAFEETSYDELSVIGIPEVLLKIVSCLVYVQENNHTVILTCRSKLVSYYLSKGFLILEKYSPEMNNVTIRVKQCICAVDIHKNSSLITCNREIPSVGSTLKQNVPQLNRF